MNFLRHALLMFSILSLSSASANGQVLPDKGEYVVVKDGHLTQGDKPIRFWGAIGSFPDRQETIKGDPYYRQRAAIRRAKMVGFNMFRLWSIGSDDKTKKGDLSGTDVSDFFIAECGRQGVHIWGAGYGSGELYDNEVEAAAKQVPDEIPEKEWIEAVKGMCKIEWWSNNQKGFQLLNIATAWDPRLEAVSKSKVKAKAQHINVHTGMRNSDDPTFAVWELTNEQWWMSRMLGGQWQELPAPLRKSLINKWNRFIDKKYHTNTEIQRAWGFLFPGEDLASGTILLAPMGRSLKAVELNDTNPAAIAAFKSIETPIGRDQSTTARANDVIEFFLEILLSHKQRMGAELKTWGKSCQLSPLIYDTGIGESIQVQYMQLQADAVSHASYMEGIQESRISKSHKRYPFYSRLDQQPNLSNDVTWLEHNRPVNKPFLCYETQFGSPSKYRAEWPVLISALGSIQDWDAACYHYWTSEKYDYKSATPFTGPLSFPANGAYQYDYTHDEVEQATMRAAGAVFRNKLVAPAINPTVFSWGKPALLDPKSMDYAGSYGPTGLHDMATTTYVNGVRIAIDPTQSEYLKTTGPVTRFNGFERPTPLRPSKNVVYDAQRAYVQIDAPGVAGYTGFLGEYGSNVVQFANGVVLRDVIHLSPAGTPYPAGKEKFTSFTLASEDGNSLASCKKAVIALVSSSFNTGLKMTPKANGETDFQWGDVPVLVTRVGATIIAKPIAGMRYRMIDFNEKVLFEGVIPASGELKVSAKQPVWIIELSRK